MWLHRDLRRKILERGITAELRLGGWDLVIMPLTRLGG